MTGSEIRGLKIE